MGESGRNMKRGIGELRQEQSTPHPPFIPDPWQLPLPPCLLYSTCRYGGWQHRVEAHHAVLTQMPPWHFKPKYTQHSASAVQPRFSGMHLHSRCGRIGESLCRACIGQIGGQLC